MQIVAVAVVFRTGCDHVQVILTANHGGDLLLAAVLPFLIAFRPPVRHDNAVIAPFLPQDSGQQVIVAARPQAVDRAVCRHDAECTRFPQGNRKAFEIQFPQRTLGHNGFRVISAIFLIVARKMLDSAANTAALQALDDRRRHFTRQQRIFRKILEVAPVQRMPMQIHARCKQQVNAVAAHFLPRPRIQI